MQHEWKIGDWCEYRSQRGLVYKIDRSSGVGLVRFVMKDGAAGYSYLDSEVIKHLPDCTGWDWQPPDPIEPPEGHRLLTVGDFIVADDLMLDQQWRPVHALSVGRQYDPACFYAIARKIPQVRPMTRDEFLQAWEERGFCPLIDPDDGYDFFERIVIDDCEDDQEIISLRNRGWCSLDELAAFRFAKDKTFLTVEK